MEYSLLWNTILNSIQEMTEAIYLYLAILLGTTSNSGKIPAPKHLVELLITNSISYFSDMSYSSLFGKKVHMFVFLQQRILFV